MIRDATKDEVAALLKQFERPQNRLHVDNWPEMAQALRAEAKRYGLALPPYLEEDGHGV